MKDTSLPIRKAYNTLLTDLGYTCFDFKATDNTKNSFGNVATINLDVVTSFDDGFGGRFQLDEIVNDILESVLPTPDATVIQAEGFNIYSTKKLIDFDFDPIANETQTIYRRIITFEHLVEQL